MEQKELAIHVDRVSKVYKLYRRNRDRLIESLGLTKKKLSTPHYALKDVSLDIYKGETVGIIGTNGSEKWLILGEQNDPADAGVDTFLQQPVFQRRIVALEKVTDIGIHGKCRKYAVYHR